MDIFEKFVTGAHFKRPDERKDYKVIGQKSLVRKLRNTGGFAPGIVIGLLRVVGKHEKQGALSVYTNREYVCECIAATGPEGAECGTRVITTYHQLYYKTVFSCGCLKRAKHPPYKLEGQRVGVLEILRWTHEGWEAVCVECGEVFYERRIGELRRIGQDCPHT